MKSLWVFLIALFILSCKKDEVLSNFAIQIKGPCTTQYSAEDYHRLVELTDTNTVKNISDVKSHMNELTTILLKYKDRVGAFTVLYNAITNDAYNVLSVQVSPHIVESRRFMTEFANHYLRSFHNYLTGKPIEQGWLKYFKDCADCHNTILHLGLTGINVHITYDIPFVLHDMNAQPDFFPEYRQHTDFIAAGYPDAAVDLKNVYGVQNASNVFHIFDFGLALDGILGDGATTHAIIDMLRVESWDKSRALINGTMTIPQMETMLFKSFTERDKLIDDLQDQNLLY